MRSPCQPDSRAHLRRLRLCALAGGLLLALAATGDAAAQLRKVCKPVGVDQMVCTEDKSAKASRARASAAKPAAPQETASAPPAWKIAVAKAVLEGRCADAKRIALQNGDLEAAKVGVDLCVKR
jgi:hypothetical protein